VRADRRTPYIIWGRGFGRDFQASFWKPLLQLVALCMNVLYQTRTCTSPSMHYQENVLLTWRRLLLLRYVPKRDLALSSTSSGLLHHKCMKNVKWTTHLMCLQAISFKLRGAFAKCQSHSRLQKDQCTGTAWVETSSIGA